MATTQVEQGCESTDLYEGLDFGPAELKRTMRETYDAIIAFVTTPEFSAFHKELMALVATERPSFLRRTIFNEAELKRRGIVVPEGILIQTSAFGDRRPTLFAVKKMMPDKFHVVWENMNLTFDNEYSEHDVSQNSENSWRPPLPVSLQNSLLERGCSLESVPVEDGVKFGMYERADGLPLDAGQR